MATATNKQQVSPVVIIIAVVLLVVLVGFYGYKTLKGYEPEVKPVSAAKKAESDFIVQKAKECQGNFSQLSASDQQKINELTKGFGPMSISQAYAASQRK